MDTQEQAPQLDSPSTINLESAPTIRPNLYCTIAEYSERLKVSRGTIFGWLRVGLPSFRIGRTRRIVIEKADRWLENGGADPTRKSVRSKRAHNR